MSQTESIAKRPTVYQSAIDGWIAIMLMITPIIAAAIGVYTWSIGQPGDAAIMFMAGAVTLLVTLAFTLPCRYTLLDDAVSIRCGLICYQIAYSEITAVEPTWTIRSGPALSMRRVQIKTNNRAVIVSPKDRDGFIESMHREITSTG